MRAKLDVNLIREYNEVTIETVDKMLKDIDRLHVNITNDMRNQIKKNPKSLFAVYLKNDTTKDKLAIMYLSEVDAFDTFTELLVKGYVDATDSYLYFNIRNDTE